MIEKDIDGSATGGTVTPAADASGEQKQQTMMCPEEKDLKKLQIEKLKNAIAIPIFDKQTAAPIAVVQAYNFDELNYLKSIEQWVRIDPNQYQWEYKRFRRYPEGSVPLY